MITFGNAHQHDCEKMTNFTNKRFFFYHPGSTQDLLFSAFRFHSWQAQRIMLVAGIKLMSAGCNSSSQPSVLSLLPKNFVTENLKTNTSESFSTVIFKFLDVYVTTWLSCKWDEEWSSGSSFEHQKKLRLIPRDQKLEENKHKAFRDFLQSKWLRCGE